MKIWIEVDITEDKTTADLTEFDTEFKVAEKIMTAFNLYKHDYVSVILEEKKSEEAPHRARVDYVAEKQKRLLHIEFPPDDPWESTGYTGRPGPAETWDK